MWLIENKQNSTKLTKCPDCGMLYKESIGHYCQQKKPVPLEEMCTGEKRKNKFGSEKVVVNNLIFDSKHEYQRWMELKVLEKLGEITELKRQVKYELIPRQEGERACNYLADFVYKDDEGKTVVEDAKGARTKDYIIKRKLMLHKYGIKILEV